jgi:serine/threonine protein kinase
VLLGFQESEASYVWSIGIIIDQLMHDKPFYRKINEILSRKGISFKNVENYQVRDESLSSCELLRNMLQKNHKQRPSLEQARTDFLALF